MKPLNQNSTMSLQKKETEKLLKLDFVVIDDAVRRLIDGTGFLEVSDGFDPANHVFNMMTSAIDEHVKIEENIIFPLIGPSSSAVVAPDFIEKMKTEHRQLKILLQTVRQELQAQHAIAFHAVLREFSEALREHTKLELTIPYDKIVNRIDRQTLEPLRDRIARGYVD